MNDSAVSLKQLLKKRYLIYLNLKVICKGVIIYFLLPTGINYKFIFGFEAKLQQCCPRLKLYKSAPNSESFQNGINYAYEAHQRY